MDSHSITRLLTLLNMVKRPPTMAEMKLVLHMPIADVVSECRGHKWIHEAGLRCCDVTGQLCTTWSIGSEKSEHPDPVDDTPTVGTEVTK